MGSKKKVKKGITRGVPHPSKLMAPPPPHLDPVRHCLCLGAGVAFTARQFEANDDTPY